jgi:hypothetical protein
MAVESAADRLIFLSADDFGVEASYTPVAGGAAATIRGIFDAAFTAVDLSLDVPVTSVGPQIIVRSADLSSGGRHGDTFVIAAATYKARDVQPDGTGLTTVRLEKQ